MKECYDCIHFDVCNEAYEFEIFGDHTDDCERYSPKSEWLHLPCKIGDTVYVDSRNVGRFGLIEYKQGIYKARAVAFIRNEFDMFIKLMFTDRQTFQTMTEMFSAEEIGETVFLTEAEAEQAINESKRESEQ